MQSDEKASVDTTQTVTDITGERSIDAVGTTVSVPVNIVCTAGTGSCLGGYILNLGKVIGKETGNYNYSAQVNAYFDGNTCPSSAEVGALKMDDFLEVYVGDDWRYDLSGYGGGKLHVKLSIQEHQGSTVGPVTRDFGYEDSSCFMYKKPISWKEPRGHSGWALCSPYYTSERGTYGCSLVNKRITAPSVSGDYYYSYTISTWLESFYGSSYGNTNRYGWFKVNWNNNNNVPHPNTNYNAPASGTTELPCWVSVGQCNGDYKLPLGIAEAYTYDMGPDPTVDNFVDAIFSQKECGYGAFVGTVSPRRNLILYIPRITVQSYSDSTYTEVYYDVTEYQSQNCMSGYETGRQWVHADDTSSPGINNQDWDEARADRGAYCDGYYGDTSDGWHLPDSSISPPSLPGMYSYKYTIHIITNTTTSDVDEGCFSTYWGE